MDIETENSSKSKGPFYSRQIFLLIFCWISCKLFKAVIAVIGISFLMLDLWWLCNQMFSYDGSIVITPWLIITALTACMKVNRISTEIFVCCKRVLWILTSFQSQCPSILIISIITLLLNITGPMHDQLTGRTYNPVKNII